MPMRVGMMRLMDLALLLPAAKSMRVIPELMYFPTTIPMQRVMWPRQLPEQLVGGHNRTVYQLIWGW